MLWIKRAPWRQIEQLGLLFSLYSVAGMSSKRDRAEERYSCTNMRRAICEHVIRAGFTWNKESIHTLRSEDDFKSKQALLSWVLNSFENHLCWYSFRWTLPLSADRQMKEEIILNTFAYAGWAGYFGKHICFDQ